MLKVVNKIIILLEHFGKNKYTASAKLVIRNQNSKLENDDDEVAVHLLFYSIQNSDQEGFSVHCSLYFGVTQ